MPFNEVKTSSILRLEHLVSERRLQQKEASNETESATKDSWKLRHFLKLRSPRLDTIFRKLTRPCRLPQSFRRTRDLENQAATFRAAEEGPTTPRFLRTATQLLQLR